MKLNWKLFRARDLDALIDIANDYVYHGKLEKIIEITYSYRDIGDGFYLNETLFEEYLGLSYPEYSLGSLLLKYKYQLGLQILKIESIIKKARHFKTQSRNENLRKVLFCDSLEYVKDILEISLLGADFEAEKGGYILPFFKKDAQLIVKKIEAIEKRAFGPKISEIREEFLYCYQFIYENHQKQNQTLSKQDRILMDELMKKIEKKSNFPLTIGLRPKQHHIDTPFFHKHIQRKDYRNIFDSICEFYELPQRTRLTNAGSIYDGDDFLEIPKNNFFQSFPLKRVLKLIAHEIESHYINSYNGKILLGSFRGSRNLPKEEGLAVFMEEIFFGNSYDTIETNIESFFTTFVGEILSGEEFEIFMRIFGKEYSCKHSYQTSLQRAKRNYSNHYAGVQHKDTAYFRGFSSIVSYLKSGGKFWKLFLGKVGFDDIDNLFQLYELHENKQEIIFPVFMSDAILYYLEQKQKDTEFEFEVCEYYLYLKKKYWFIGLENFEIIEYIRRKEKEFIKILKQVERLVL